MKLAHLWAFAPAQAHAAKFPETFKEFLSRHTPARFTIDQVLEKLKPHSN